MEKVIEILLNRSNYEEHLNAVYLYNENRFVGFKKGFGFTESIVSKDFFYSEEISFDTISNFLWESIIVRPYLENGKYFFGLTSYQDGFDEWSPMETLLTYVGTPLSSTAVNVNNSYYIDNIKTIDNNNYFIYVKETKDKLDFNKNDIKTLFEKSNSHDIEQSYTDEIKFNTFYVNKDCSNYYFCKELGYFNVTYRHLSKGTKEELLRKIDHINSTFGKVIYVSPFKKNGRVFNNNYSYYQNMRSGYNKKLFVLFEAVIPLGSKDTLAAIHNINNQLKSIEEYLFSHYNPFKEIKMGLRQPRNNSNYQEDYLSVNYDDFDWEENRISLMSEGIIDEDGDWTGY